MAAVQPRKPTNDAEAILIADLCPGMRFVEPKTVEQQAKAIIPWPRTVGSSTHRTELVNGLRAILYESGHVFPTGLVHLQPIETLLEDPACDLPMLMVSECRDLLRQIAEKTERIEVRTKF